MDMFGFMVSFKGVFLEGLEVVFIVLTFGLSANNVPAAVYGAAAAIVLVLIAAVLIRKPLSMVPENTLKFGVGLLLTSFGMFWSIEGLGIFRDGHHSLEFPGGDLAVLYFLASVSLLCAVLIRILRLPARPAAIVDSAGDAAAGRRHPDDRDRGGLVIRFLKAFGRFWYDFIIGDDWKIAVGVVIALALTWLLFAVGVPEKIVTVLGGALILAAFTISLAIDLRPKTKR